MFGSNAVLEAGKEIYLCVGNPDRLQAAQDVLGDVLFALAKKLHNCLVRRFGNKLDSGRDIAFRE